MIFHKLKIAKINNSLLFQTIKFIYKNIQYRDALFNVFKYCQAKIFSYDEKK